MTVVKTNSLKSLLNFKRLFYEVFSESACLKCVSVVIPKVQTATLWSVFEDDMLKLREGYHAHSASFVLRCSGSSISCLFISKVPHLFQRFHRALRPSLQQALLQPCDNLAEKSTCLWARNVLGCSVAQSKSCSILCFCGMATLPGASESDACTQDFGRRRYLQVHRVFVSSLCGMQ